MRGGSADMTEVETGLREVDLLEIGLREVDLLTRLKWRQDCERWIC